MFNTAIKPAEILAAAPDFLSVQMGLAPERPHPLANSLSLKEIAYAQGLKIRPKQGHEDDRAVVARGLNSGDFSKLMADAVRGVSVSVYAGAAEEYMGFCATTEVQNFQPESVPAIDGDLGLRMLGEFAEVQHGQAFAATTGNAVQLSTFARICTLSRQLLLNDGFQAIKTIFASVGAHAAQLEASLIAEVLNGNPTLDDGQPIFSSDNTVGVTLDAIELGSAMAMLRNQANAAGNPLNLRARHIVCAPAIEYMARRLVLDAGLEIEVAALAGLDGTRWFVLPSPEVHPVVSVVRLAGNKSPLRIEQKILPTHDGLAIRASADMGVCMLRRTGIVKGGA